MIAYAVAGYLYTRLGMKLSFVLAYSLSLAGMTALLVYRGDSQVWLSIFILGGKFGISASFNLVYVGNQYLFPVQAVVFAYAACNLFSRILTTLAPLVAELKPESVAKWVFIFVAGAALLTILLLKDKRL